jgi:hypothetical protein
MNVSAVSTVGEYVVNIYVCLNCPGCEISQGPFCQGTHWWGETTNEQSIAVKCFCALEKRKIKTAEEAQQGLYQLRLIERRIKVKKKNADLRYKLPDFKTASTVYQLCGSGFQFPSLKLNVMILIILIATYFRELCWLDGLINEKHL